MRRLLCFSLLGLCLGHAAAQNTVTAPVDIRLVPVFYGDYYKYGIYATLGGSTNAPGLFEFDTGGSGFYAVAGGTNTSYWGTNYTPSGQTFTNSYDSGNVYTGNSVTTTVSIFSAREDGNAHDTAAIVTAPNILVGQTTSITNIYGKNDNWPSDSAPVDQAFYGDFGLALKSSDNQIMNLFAQLDYGPGVIPGFVVKLGAYGSSDPKVQVGLAEDEHSKYSIKIQMAGKDTTNTFPNSELPTYSEQIITAQMTLTNGGLVYSGTIGVTLDTGATPKLHDVENDTTTLPSFFVTNYTTNQHTGEVSTNISVMNGTELSLFATETNGVTTLNIFEMGINATNSVMVQLSNNFYINMGATLFYQYDVMYDLKDGVLGLRAVPEASQAVLMAAGVLTVIGGSLARTALRRNKSRNR